MIETADRWAEVLCCPLCLGPVSGKAQGEEGFLCPACGMPFPMVTNIPVMTGPGEEGPGVKEATELEAQKSEHLGEYESRETNEKVRSRVADLLARHGLAAGAGSRILEIGCGPFESLHDVSGEIKIGVDLLATAYAAALPVHRVASNVVEAFAEALPFRDSFFDLVVSRNSFDHLNEPEMALQEFNRVLRKDGTCVIECYVDSDPSVAHEPFVMTDRFIRGVVTQYFDVRDYRRVARFKDGRWDWVELRLSPRTGQLRQRPRGPGLFGDIRRSYLELHARGCLLLSRGELGAAIDCFRESVDRKESFFWNAAYLARACFRAGMNGEGRRIVRRIRKNIREGRYPFVESPEDGLAEILKDAGHGGFWRRALGALGR